MVSRPERHGDLGFFGSGARQYRAGTWRSRRPFFLPLFTEVPRRGVLRSSFAAGQQSHCILATFASSMRNWEIGT